MEDVNKRELLKKCIEQSAEIVRFLLESNKRPKILEELPEDYLNSMYDKTCNFTCNFYLLTRSARQIFILQEQEKESQALQRR